MSAIAQPAAVAAIAPGSGAAKARAEWLCALLLLGAVGAAGGGALRLYERAIVPSLTPPVVPAAPYGVPASDRDAMERLQLTNDLLGEAIAYRNAKRQDWADAVLARALELDPSHPTARELLKQWAAEPAPPLTEAERAAREREARAVELLGAAASLESAGRVAEAARLRAEAAALR